MARAFRRDEDDVHVCGRNDRLVVDGKTMGEEQRLARREVRFDVFLVDLALLGVRQPDEDHVGLFHGLGGRDDLETGLLGDRDRLAALIEADDHVETGILEVQRVGVALRTEAEHGQRLVCEHAEVGVFVLINFSCHICFVWRRCPPRCRYCRMKRRGLRQS